MTSKIGSPSGLITLAFVLILLTGCRGESAQGIWRVHAPCENREQIENIVEARLKLDGEDEYREVAGLYDGVTCGDEILTGAVLVVVDATELPLEEKYVTRLEIPGSNGRSFTEPMTFCEGRLEARVDAYGDYEQLFEPLLRDLANAATSCR